MFLRDINTTPTLAVVFLTVPLKNYCYTCSFETIIASAAFSGISSCSLEDSWIRYSIGKFAIAWPFIAFCGQSMSYSDNSKTQFASLSFNEHCFIMCNLNGLTLEMSWIV